MNIDSRSLSLLKSPPKPSRKVDGISPSPLRPLDGDASTTGSLSAAALLSHQQGSSKQRKTTDNSSDLPKQHNLDSFFMKINAHQKSTPPTLVPLGTTKASSSTDTTQSITHQPPPSPPSLPLTLPT